MSAENKLSEPQAWLQVMDAVRNYAEHQRDVIVSEVGMHMLGVEEGAKYWAQGLASDVEELVMGLFKDWESDDEQG